MWTALGAAVFLLGASLLAPRVLRPLNIAWFRLSLLLNKIVSPIVMFVLFAVFVIPIWQTSQ